MSEKIGGAKGTELDDDFTEMERVRFFCMFLAHLSHRLKVSYCDWSSSVISLCIKEIR